MEFDQLKQTTLELQKKPHKQRLIFCQKLLSILAQSYQEKDFTTAGKLAALAKSLKTPLENLDLMRGLTFLNLGDTNSAREALKEELRYFPQNTQALELLNQLPAPNLQIPPNAPQEFIKLYETIAPYTMLSDSRLFSLYTHAQDICERQIEGNFVECGVAGGGSSGLLASVLQQKDKQKPKRILFSCDSFEGMPPTTQFDTHAGQHAENTGWGTGTCAAPESNVLQLCKKLFASNRIEIVKGYFEQTLPNVREKIGKIAFLHMDGDWYESTKTILENLYDNLVPGAFVQIDDYGHWDGCKKAVHDFFTYKGAKMPELNKIDYTGVFFYKK